MGKTTGGRKGQPRKSAAEKAKTGSVNSTREKRYAQQEMKAVALSEYPPAPDDLGPEGKAHWDVVVRQLTTLRVISAVDLFNLRALCIEWECYIQHRQQQIEIGGSYYKIESEKGTSYQPHPVHYNGTNHLREYCRLCNEFGLTPAARAKIGINAQETTTSKAATLHKKAV